jgi:hypothetical integral membrane protein (TIGR02206 family)
MFNPALEETFVTFGWSHLAAVSVVVTILALIILHHERLRAWKHWDLIRYGLVILTLGQEVSLNVYRIVMDEWQFATSLPLELCGLGVLSSAFLLLRPNERLFQRIVFVMMIGATMALLTPSIDHGLGIPHYRYFQFFTSHGLIVINYTVLLFVYDFHRSIRYRHLLQNIVTLIVLATVMLGINLLVDGNYMYLLAKPEGTAFDLFGEWPWYLLNIFLFGIPVMFHVFYLPFFVRDLRQRRRALA